MGAPRQIHLPKPRSVRATIDNWVQPGGSPRSARPGGVVAVIVAALVVATAGCGGGSGSSNAAESSAPPSSGRASVVVYRTPTCGCCKSYEDYLRKHGFGIESKVLDDLAPVRADNGVPSDASSCHTVILDGYAVEGHVPVEAIDLLLKDRPDIDGIGIPGMPTNAPGMGERDGKPLEVVSFDEGRVGAFTTL